VILMRNDWSNSAIENTTPDGLDCLFPIEECTGKSFVTRAIKENVKKGTDIRTSPIRGFKRGSA